MHSIRFYLLKAFLLFFLTTPLYAGHITGSYIRHEATNNADEYTIFLEVYTECGGVSSGAIITVANNCNSNVYTEQLTLDYSEDISQYCYSMYGNQGCLSGQTGRQKQVYTGVVNLSGTCNSWRVSYKHPTRQSSNLVLSEGIYVETFINSGGSSDNVSSKINAPPNPFVCINQPIVWNFGITDLDNDSLVYEIISPRKDYNTNVVFLPGYSAGSPIPGITIDSQTGDISFNSTTPGIFTVALLVKEYSQVGALVGSTNIDFQFIVSVCTNNQPVFDTISNFNNFGTGASLSSDAREIDMCAGDQFCFDLVLNDIDLSDTLTITSNIDAILPNANILLSGVNPIIMQVCWAYDPNVQPNTILFQGTDNACDIYGVHNYTLTVNAPPGIHFSYNDSICGDMTVDIGNVNAVPLNWSFINGDSISIGNNFSCNNCAFPVIKPSITSTYLVNDGTNCGLSDTVTITVADNLENITTELLINDSLICLGSCLDMISVSTKTEINTQYFNGTSTNGLSFGPDTIVFQPMFVPQTAISGNLIQQGNIDKVCIDLSISEPGALELELVTPSGTVFVLSANNGGQGVDFANTCFTAAATNLISLGAPPFSGDYIPDDGALDTALIGETVQGIWKIRVINSSTLNSGTLNSWSIRFKSLVPYIVPADSVSWSNTNGLSDSLISNPTICPGHTGTYILTSYNQYNCFASDTVNIIVDSGPDAGADTTVNVNVYGGSIYLFNYLTTGANVGSGLWVDGMTNTAATSVVNPDTLADPALFYFITENALQCSDTSILTIDIYGYCDTPPVPPNPNITPLPYVGDDSTYYVPVSLDSINLFGYLSPGIATMGIWTNSFGDSISEIVDLVSMSGSETFTYTLVNIHGCTDSSFLTIIPVDDLSIIGHHKTDHLFFYPNPASAHIQLWSPDAIIVDVKMINQLGQVVHTINGYNSGHDIDLHFLSPGIYYMQIVDELQNIVFVQKVQLK